MHARIRMHTLTRESTRERGHASARDPSTPATTRVKQPHIHNTRTIASTAIHAARAPPPTAPAPAHQRYPRATARLRPVSVRRRAPSHPCAQPPLLPRAAQARRGEPSGASRNAGTHPRTHPRRPPRTRARDRVRAYQVVYSVGAGYGGRREAGTGGATRGPAPQQTNAKKAQRCTDVM